MKIVRDDEPSKEKPKKGIPMYKDQAFMAKLKKKFIAAHNKRIQKKEAQGNIKTN